MAVAGILGKKVGMAQLFDDKGDVRPVTVLQAGPCVVTQRKTVTKDGYDAAQIGLVEFVKESRLTKAMKGHFAKNNLPPLRILREVPIVVDPETQDGTKVGDKVLVDMFDGEKFVDIAGTSKGRGFAGVVKRHKFAGGAGSHGSMFQITWFDRIVFVSVARVQRHAHVGPYGRGPRHGSQPAGAGRRQRREPAGGGRRGAGTQRQLRINYQGEEAAERASWIQRRRHGRSVEGFEARGRRRRNSCQLPVVSCRLLMAAGG